MTETQSFQNHVRWYPLVHFVIMPLLILNLIWQIVRLYQQPDWDRAENILLAVTLVLLSFAARLQPLTAQNRIIKLEEKLRYKEILSADLQRKAEQLDTSQIIALRFASDKELGELIERTLNGELKTSKEIKTAIKNWRGDYLRV